MPKKVTKRTIAARLLLAGLVLGTILTLAVSAVEKLFTDGDANARTDATVSTTAQTDSSTGTSQATTEPSKQAPSTQKDVELPSTSQPTPKSQANAATGGGSIDVSKLDITSADSLYVLIDKQHPLNPKNYRPKLVKVGLPGASAFQLRPEANAALVEMSKAMEKEGVGAPRLTSAYRTYETQRQLFNSYASRFGLQRAEVSSARPGYSEHETGLAVDLHDYGNCYLKPCFADTKTGKWLAENSTRFGFIMSYPRDSQQLTGYIFEPWHFRYVGKEVAQDFKASGKKTYAQYLGLVD